MFTLKYYVTLLFRTVHYRRIRCCRNVTVCQSVLVIMFLVSKNDEIPHLYEQIIPCDKLLYYVLFVLVASQPNLSPISTNNTRQILLFPCKVFSFSANNINTLKTLKYYKWSIKQFAMKKIK